MITYEKFLEDWSKKGTNFIYYPDKNLQELKGSSGICHSKEGYHLCL